jgi:hypothetical protein
MKNKSFLSKLEELKPQVPIHLEVERKLIPRLKFMGYTMFTLCLAAFVFALIVPEEAAITTEAIPEDISTNLEIEEATAPLTDDSELELTPTEVLNFYAVSFVFALVGVACFLIAAKKRKTLFQESPLSEK